MDGDITGLTEEQMKEMVGHVSGARYYKELENLIEVGVKPEDDLRYYEKKPPYNRV